jgi:hypothetical protein
MGAVEVQVNPTTPTQAYSAKQDRTLDVPADRGVLSGATSDSAAPALIATLVNGPAHGTLALAPDGGFTYTPAAGYVGGDAFDFAATDGCGGTSSATAAITVGVCHAARGLPRLLHPIATTGGGLPLQLHHGGLPLQLPACTPNPQLSTLPNRAQTANARQRLHHP